MNRPRFPKTVTLPFGYKIKVRRVTARFLGRWAHRKQVPGGLWVVERSTIYVLNTLPIEEQWGTFRHEMEHVLADWKLELGQSVPIRDPFGMEVPSS